MNFENEFQFEVMGSSALVGKYTSILLVGVNLRKRAINKLP